MAQPNFQNLSNSLASMARELALMTNLPAVDYRGPFLDIQKILQEIQRTMLQIQEQLQQQQQQLVQIRQDISRSERNNFARLLNSSASRSDCRLEVLYGVNNEPVQDFPQTPAHVQAATGPQLDALLVQLDLPVDGHVDDRKRRLMKGIGLLNF